MGRRNRNIVLVFCMFLLVIVMAGGVSAYFGNCGCPGENQDCTITSNCNVPHNSVFKFRDLTINSGKTVTVEYGSPMSGWRPSYTVQGASGGSGGSKGSRCDVCDSIFDGADGSYGGGFWSAGQSHGTYTGCSPSRALGGKAGGYVTIEARDFTLNGNIIADGEDGDNGMDCPKVGGVGGGGGSGGVVIIKAKRVSGSGKIYARGGSGGNGDQGGKGCGGGGGSGGGHGGKIELYYGESTSLSSGDLYNSGGSGGEGGLGGGRWCTGPFNAFCISSGYPGSPGSPGTTNSNWKVMSSIGEDTFTECNDGVDNDFDNLADMDDPLCQAICPNDQYKDDLKTAASALDGSDGCCGDDDSDDLGYISSNGQWLCVNETGWEWIDAVGQAFKIHTIDPEVVEVKEMGLGSNNLFNQIVNFIGDIFN